MKPLVLLGLVVLLPACTRQQVYETIQANEQAECQREVRTNAYLQCMEEVSMSYDEYQWERESVLKGE